MPVEKAPQSTWMPESANEPRGNEKPVFETTPQSSFKQRETRLPAGRRIVTASKNFLLVAIYFAVVLGICAIYSVSAILGFIVASIFVLFLVISGGRSGPTDSGNDHHWWEGLRGP
jgi:hypothetical protein